MQKDTYSKIKQKEDGETINRIGRQVNTEIRHMYREFNYYE